MARWQASAERGRSRAAPRGTDRTGYDLIVEVPWRLPSPGEARGPSLAQGGLESDRLAGRPRRCMEYCQTLWTSTASRAADDGGIFLSS
jgi:hypothetical protein